MQENSTVNSAQALAAVSAALDSLPGGSHQAGKDQARCQNPVPGLWDLPLRQGRA